MPKAEFSPNLSLSEDLSWTDGRRSPWEDPQIHFHFQTLLPSTASVNINTNPIITVFLSLIRTPLISVITLLFCCQTDFLTVHQRRHQQWSSASSDQEDSIRTKIPSAQRQNIPQSRPIRPIWPISPLCTCKITSECTVQHHHQRSKQLLFKILVRIHLADGGDSLEL